MYTSADSYKMKSTTSATSLATTRSALTPNVSLPLKHGPFPAISMNFVLSLDWQTPSYDLSPCSPPMLHPSLTSSKEPLPNTPPLPGMKLLKKHFINLKKPWPPHQFSTSLI